jgi:hypothetical protein
MNTYSKYCPNVWLAKCSEAHDKGETVTLTTKHGKENEVEIWNLIFEKDGFYYYSFTRCDGYNHQERAKAKAERYQEWADAANRRSNEAFERSEKATEHIPFGQPILVGHHSEGAHRAALKKSWAAMDKSVEEMHKAEEHESKAAYWERMADKIDLSMPESIEYYAHKLEEAKEYHEGLKSGKYEKQHIYSVTYAKKAVNEAQANYETALKLWGDTENPLTSR